MTTFVSSNSFGRGEVDESLHDLRGQDFYSSAAAYIENWYPDRVGGLFKRPALDFAVQRNSQTFDSAIDSVAPNYHSTVSLSGRSLTFNSTTYDYESKDLYMQVVELSGREVAIFVETLSRTDQDGAGSGNCVIVSAQFVNPYTARVSPDPLYLTSYKQSFTNATTGV